MAQTDLIPACVCPQTIKFILNGKSNHKEFVTIYNPYNFPTKFKIKSNASSKYLVSNPHGYIGPKSSFDVVFTHSVPTISNCGIVDKFQVTITHSKTQKVYRNIYIEAILLQSEDDTITKDTVPIKHRDFSSSKGSESNDSRERCKAKEKNLNKDANRTKKLLILMVAAVSLLMLEVLPLRDEEDSVVPVKSLTKSSISFLIGVISCYFLF